MTTQHPQLAQKHGGERRGAGSGVSEIEISGSNNFGIQKEIIWKKSGIQFCCLVDFSIFDCEMENKMSPTTYFFQLERATKNCDEQQQRTQLSASTRIWRGTSRARYSIIDHRGAPPTLRAHSISHYSSDISTFSQRKSNLPKVAHLGQHIASDNRLSCEPCY